MPVLITGRIEAIKPPVTKRLFFAGKVGISEEVPG
jgi:hypothetical protein